MRKYNLMLGIKVHPKIKEYRAHKKPLPINFKSSACLPDLNAEKDTKKILVEVETDDPNNEDHTEFEWMVLHQFKKIQ